MKPERQQLIRSLFDEYIEMYASRDDRLTSRFSENFSGYTGGGDFLVKDRGEWVAITRQDFAQVAERIRIEMLDMSMQDISDNVVIATGFFRIHLPIPDHVLSRETARLTLVFRLEKEEWKIAYSGISIPYHLVQAGEVYPLKGLHDRNRELESLVETRTQALKEANDKLEALSNTDGLTGIANRRYFNHMLSQEWNRALRANSPLSVVMLDVDHFKQYNDQYGHLVGDACLQDLAKSLKQTARRAGEFVARFGGEEFVVLLPETNGHDAIEIAKRIQREVWTLALPHKDTSPGIVTVSLGIVSMMPTENRKPEELMRQADLALYRAKNSGRNCLQSATISSLPR